MHRTRFKAILLGLPFFFPSNLLKNLFGYNTDLGKIALKEPKADDSPFNELITGPVQRSCNKFCMAAVPDMDAQFYIQQAVTIAEVRSGICLHQEGI